MLRWLFQSYPCPVKHFLSPDEWVEDARLPPDSGLHFSLQLPLKAPVCLRTWKIDQGQHVLPWRQVSSNSTMTLHPRREVLCMKTFSDKVKEPGSRLCRLTSPTRASAHGRYLHYSGSHSSFCRKSDTSFYNLSYFKKIKISVLKLYIYISSLFYWNYKAQPHGWTVTF